MALPQPKKVVVHSKIKSPWKLGVHWFTYGPNPFTREEYREFEVHPLFLRRIGAGEFTVEDPEYPAPPKDPQPEPVAPEAQEPAPADVAPEGGEVAADEAPAKKKGKGKDKEVSPS